MNSCVEPSNNPHPEDAQTAGVLLAAAELLRPPGAWTRHELARDERDHAAPPCSKRAVKWCVAGAIQRVTAGDRELIVRALEPLRPIMGGLPVGEWNDRAVSHQVDVVLALRSAARSVLNRRRKDGSTPQHSPIPGQ